MIDCHFTSHSEYIKIDDLINSDDKFHLGGMKGSGLMIDRVKVIIPFRGHIFHDGVLITVSKDGLKVTKVNKKEIKGCLSLRTIEPNHLEIEGNIANFIQGHNIFGTDDILSLIYDLVWILSIEYNCIQTRETLTKIANGDYHLYAFHVAGMYDLKKQKEVDSFIDQLKHASRVKHGNPEIKPNSVYYYYNSRIHTFHIYSKYKQIINKKKDTKQELIEHTKGKLRIEIRIHPDGLRKLGIMSVRDLLDYGLLKIYTNKLRKIRTTRVDFNIFDLENTDLPEKAKKILDLWYNRQYTLNTLSKATRYRHRKYMLQFGYDLSKIPNLLEGEKIKGSDLINSRNLKYGLDSVLPELCDIPEQFKQADLFYYPIKTKRGITILVQQHENYVYESHWIFTEINQYLDNRHYKHKYKIISVLPKENEQSYLVTMIRENNPTLFINTSNQKSIRPLPNDLANIMPTIDLTNLINP